MNAAPKSIRQQTRYVRSRRAATFLMIVFAILLMTTASLQGLVHTEISQRRSESSRNRIAMLEAAIESVATLSQATEIPSDFVVILPIQVPSSDPDFTVRVRVNLERSGGPPEQAEWVACLEVSEAKSKPFQTLDSIRRPSFAAPSS